MVRHENKAVIIVEYEVDSCLLCPHLESQDDGADRCLALMRRPHLTDGKGIDPECPFAIEDW